MYLTLKTIIRKSIVFFIIIITSSNHLPYENSFKQFYKEIYPTKPQIRKGLEIINASNTKTFLIYKLEAKEKNLNEAYENYIQNYAQKLNFVLEKLNYGDKLNMLIIFG